MGEVVNELAGELRAMVIVGSIIGIILSILNLTDTWPPLYTIFPINYWVLAVINIIICAFALFIFEIAKQVLNKIIRFRMEFVLLVILGFLLLLFSNIAGIVLVLAGFLGIYFNYWAD